MYRAPWLRLSELPLEPLDLPSLERSSAELGLG
jgi:hypothetical protein